jgi:hypothetical protein
MVLAEWLAAAGDIPLAYVNSRTTDDPSLKHRITVMTGAGEGNSHLVFAPAGRDVWIVLTKGQRVRLRRHKTLPAALNSIRRVLVEITPDRSRRRPNAGCGIETVVTGEASDDAVNPKPLPQ